MLDLNESRLWLFSRTHNDVVGPLLISCIHYIIEIEKVRNQDDLTIKNDSLGHAEIL